ncbi:MAG: hypothetical protein K1X91_10645 [Bacteriodetes bacterium]|nr:hypothetical protein [Bacteroidota bacterium]
MNKDEISALVSATVSDYLSSIGADAQVTGETRLVGSNAVVDSVGLVSVIVDVEGRLADAGIDVSLLSDKAMSMQRSPFRSVDSLAEFINEELNPVA